MGGTSKNRTRCVSWLGIAVGLGLLAAAPAFAQSAAPPGPSKQTTAAPAAAPAIDPAAIAALERMGAFLRSQQNFAVRAETTTDEVLDSGQKIQFQGLSDIWVRRPNGLRIDITTDRKKRQLFYDGSTFTLYGPNTGFYASFEAPPTLAGLVEVAEGTYGVEMPLADLFFWGTEKSGINDIQSAIDVGPSQVDGVACEHYAFRQADVDWQICIEKGAQPLPRKFVITTKNEQGQPQHTSILRWNLAPQLEGAVFGFVPPVGSHKIPFDASRKAAP